MSVFDRVLGLVTGGEGEGIVGAVHDVVDRLIPDKAAAEELKGKLTIALYEHNERVQAALDAAKAEQDRADEAAEDAFNKRIADMEGTATDLRSVWVVGPVLLFLRGAQRTAWGWGILFADVQVWSGKWYLPDAGYLPIAFLVVNFLVLGFLFGERSLANLLPLVMQFMDRLGKLPGTPAAR